jgi:single-strand DNA-binding protein
MGSCAISSCGLSSQAKRRAGGLGSQLGTPTAGGGVVDQSLNKVMIIGTIGREPEMRYTPSGRPVASFCIGASRRWEDASGDQHREDEWFNVVAWDGLAEWCREQVASGQQAYVDGRLKTRGWTDTEGNKCYRTEVLASEVIVLGSCPDVVARGAATSLRHDASEAEQEHAIQGMPATGTE